MQMEAKFLSLAQGQSLVFWGKDVCSAGCWTEAPNSPAVQQVITSVLGLLELLVTSEISCP